jgi:hypothetical protein
LRRRCAMSAVLARRGIDGPARSRWYFPTAEEYAAKLPAAGFTIDAIALYPRATPLPTDMRGWLETFAGSLFAALARTRRGAR